MGFVTAFLHLLIFSPFTSPSFFLPTTTMLTSITSSLRPSFSLATRALATTNVVRQQPNYSEDVGEQVFRPSNVQSKRMGDVGTRSIFTPRAESCRGWDSSRKTPLSSSLKK